MATPGPTRKPSDQLTNRPTTTRTYPEQFKQTKRPPFRILLICALEGGKTSQKHINLIVLHLLLMKFRINIIPLLFCSHPLSSRGIPLFLNFLRLSLVDDERNGGGFIIQTLILALRQISWRPNGAPVDEHPRSHRDRHPFRVFPFGGIALSFLLSAFNGN